MTLHPDWRRILRRAWSIRLMLLAGLLSGLEALIPFFAPHLALLIPRSVLALLILLLVAGAFVARLVAQKGMQ